MSYSKTIIEIFKKAILSQRGQALTGSFIVAGVIALSGFQISMVSVHDITSRSKEKSETIRSDINPHRLFNRQGIKDVLGSSDLVTNSTIPEDAFISGNYTGNLGFWNIWVPEAVFKRDGNKISGWMILVHDDFIVKQNFSGKVVLDIRGSGSSEYRHVRVDMFGTDVEYLKTSLVFDERMEERPQTFIRQIHYSSFSQDNEEGGVVLLGRVNYSGLNRDFPAYYYNIYGNFILTKL
ncbi:MAG: hypothetical protein KAI43_13115 [Candidatus Aureabacteria bacterium]|nr:hypothetical protein [Candidatus Auribacterota bacterium]